MISENGTPFKDASNYYPNSASGVIEVESSVNQSLVGCTLLEKENNKSMQSKISFYQALTEKEKKRHASNPPSLSTDQKQTYFWGFNKCGLIKNSKKVIRKAQRLQVLNGLQIQNISCGPTQIAIIDQKDNLYMLGKQLSIIWNEPTRILPNVAQVSCGKDFTLIITKTGQLFSFGLNQLPGVNLSTATFHEAKRIKHPQVIKSVSASDQVAKTPSLLLSVDQQVYVGTKVIQIGEPCISVSCGYALGISGALYFIQNTQAKKLESPFQFTKISCSSSACLAMSTGGQLYQFNRDQNGFQRLKQLTSRILSFSASQSHCICLDVEGLVWTWGTNNKGELGLGDIAPRVVPYPNSTLKNKMVQIVIAGDGYSIAMSKVRTITDKPRQISGSRLVTKQKQNTSCTLTQESISKITPESIITSFEIQKPVSAADSLATLPQNQKQLQQLLHDHVVKSQYLEASLIKARGDADQHQCSLKQVLDENQKLKHQIEQSKLNKSREHELQHTQQYLQDAHAQIEQLQQDLIDRDQQLEQSFKISQRLSNQIDVQNQQIVQLQSRSQEERMEAEQARESDWLQTLLDQANLHLKNITEENRVLQERLSIESKSLCQAQIAQNNTLSQISQMSSEMQILARSNDGLLGRIQQLQDQLAQQQSGQEQQVRAIQQKLEQALDEIIKEKQQHLQTRSELQQMKVFCEEQKLRLVHEQTNIKLMRIESEAMTQSKSLRKSSFDKMSCPQAVILQANKIHGLFQIPGSNQRRKSFDGVSQTAVNFLNAQNSITNPVSVTSQALSVEAIKSKYLSGTPQSKQITTQLTHDTKTNQLECTFNIGQELLKIQNQKQEMRQSYNEQLREKLVGQLSTKSLNFQSKENTSPFKFVKQEQQPAINSLNTCTISAHADPNIQTDNKKKVQIQNQPQQKCSNMNDGICANYKQFSMALKQSNK